MTLILGPSGIYECDFRRSGLKRLHLSLKTRDRKIAQRRHDAVEKVVRQKRAELIDQLRTKTLTVERLEAMVEHHEPLVPVAVTAKAAERDARTVDDARAEYVEWMEAHPKKAEQTARNADFQLQRFANFVYEGQRLGDLSLDAVTNKMIRAYQQSFIDAGTSPNSITVYLSRVGALWRWAQREEERAAREAKRAPRPIYSPVDPDTLYADRRTKDRVLTPIEVTALFIATPAPLLFPVACGLYAGFRLGEVLHLRPGLDVDLELGTLAVRTQRDWKPKTKRSIRVVPIASAVKPILERHLDRYASASWVMPGPLDGRYAMQQLTFRLHFKAIVERAGLTYGRENPSGVTFHTLRHTFASHAVMRGVDLYTVAQLLGDSLKMVEDTYAHLSPDFKRAAIAQFEGAFSLPDTSQMTLEMTQKAGAK